MSVKDEIINIFESNRGVFHSGEELASKLGVSRNAVWKAVKQLESDGYKFDAVSGKGYCLAEENDVLSEQGIIKYLGDFADKVNLKVCKTVSSTNTVLKEMAVDGAPEGTVLIASEQTAGRGRMNRSFYSPENTGLYLSILLRPKMKAEESLFMTAAAAVAVARTIEEVSGKSAGIKWVNDVFVGNRKVCGILTEASFDMESGRLEYAIPGIGVNVSTPEGGFPDEIKDVATAVFDGIRPPKDAKNRIAAGIIKYFMEYYKNLSEHTFFDEYVRRSIIVGKDVKVIGHGEPRVAKALAVDYNCNLRVRYEDGSEDVLSSGEVSIKKL